MKNKYDKVYIAIDLKSFYASVECQERGLNPITTNLVVADSSRTEKTVCLAVSPSLKQYGIPGRARLFEVIQKVNEINAQRKINAPGHKFTCSSYDDIALKKNNDLELSYIIAPPRMSYYMEYSTRIYNIYLKWFSADDIYVYSIDEVFIDVTHYLQIYKTTPRELATRVIKNVYDETGITATAGIGTNLYLCKVAMDIVAKHITPDKNGVRIAGLDEMTYRKYLWSHRPLTDFWRVGKGISKKLEKNGIFTMGDIARTSEKNEELLYKLFGILLLAVSHKVFLDIRTYLLAHGKRYLVVKAFKTFPSVRRYLVARLGRAGTREIDKIVRFHQLVERGLAKNRLYPVMRSGDIKDNAFYQSHVALVENVEQYELVYKRIFVNASAFFHYLTIKDCIFSKRSSQSLS